MKRAVLGVTVATSMMLLASACGDGGYVSRSRFFIYRERGEAPLCPTLLDRLDEHVQLIGAKIGLTPDADHPFHYVRYRDRSDLSDKKACSVPSGLAGCADEDTVRSTLPFHAHELAHTYVFRAWGRHSVGLLAEGVAAALSCEPFYTAQPDQTPREVLLPFLDSLDWERLLHIRGDTNAGYGAAGFFVTHLAEKHGWARVAELYRRVPPNADATSFDREFRAVYSLSMTEAWSEALDDRGGASCQMDWPCQATPLSPGSSAMPDCDGEFHGRIELDQPGAVELSLTGRESDLRLLDCTVATPTTYELFGGLSTSSIVHWVGLPQGSYTMFRGKGRRPDEVELRATWAENWMAPACDAAGTMILDPAAEHSIGFPRGPIPFTAAAGADGSAWIRIAGGGHRYQLVSLGLVWTGAHPDATVELCESCDAGAACTTLSENTTLTATIGDAAALELRHAFSLPSPVEAWGRLDFVPAD